MNMFPQIDSGEIFDRNDGTKGMAFETVGGATYKQWLTGMVVSGLCANPSIIKQPSYFEADKLVELTHAIVNRITQ